jgi:hypothetical protein
MKTQLIATTFVTILLVGCASTDKVMLDTTKRPRTQQVEVIRAGDKPQRTCKPIAEFTFLGLPEEESKAMRQFIAEAKKSGANAILLLPVENAGLRGRFGHQSLIGIPHRVFKATAIVYE